MGQMQNDRSKAKPQPEEGAKASDAKEERAAPAARDQGMAAPRGYYGYGGRHSAMQRFVDQMEEVFGGLGRSAWSPAIEVFSDEGHLVVRADLPGLSKDDLRIEIQGDVLTIAGERRHEHEGRRDGWFHSERGYGAFARTVQIPRGVKTEDAEATFDNGVLEVRFAAPEKGGRRVEIRGREASKPSTGGSDVH